MQRLDIYAVSIHDHKAQTAIAQTIVSMNPGITMRDAMETARTPPILLFRNLLLRDAEEHINYLKSMGVGFKVAIAADNSDAASGLDEILRAADQTGPKPQAAAAPKPRQPAAQPRAPLQNANDSRHGFHSGVRMGSIGVDELENREREARKKTTTFAVIVAGILLLLGLAALFFPNSNSVSVKKSARSAHQSAGEPASKNKKDSKDRKDSKQKDSKQKDAAAASFARDDGESKDRQRGQVNNTQRQYANAYMDSAKASGGNPDNAVNFYKMAISFNRYNLAAWQGLLLAYRDTNRPQEARETERQMLEIFGNEAMSVNAAVKPYGELVDAYMNDNGTYRLEYRTKRFARDEIQREIYTLTRAVRGACNCTNISIYASTGTGKGMLAHTTQRTSVHSPAAFEKQAEIVWLE